MKKIVSFGEIMGRLSPPGYGRIVQADSLNLTFGGGEANVTAALAHWGIPAAHVTKFPDNEMGRAATAYFRKVGVDMSFVNYGGNRLGLYFTEFGAAMRPSKVVYDRADSSFAHMHPNEFNWVEILEDAQWFHWTGITPAISDSAAQAVKKAIKTANEMGITVSADVNYRKNLWQYGKSVQDVMPELIEGCDIIVCGKGDAEDILNIVPDGSTKSGFESMCRQIMARFPRLKKIINTKRGQISASANTLSAMGFDGENLIKTETVEISQIVDRIGGGDAFMAGYIYGNVMGMDEKDSLRFGVAASALKHTIEGDINLSNLDEVELVLSGDLTGRLKR
ncbi:sugar kinase [Sandaracinomonas limnophila]|uniref:Sugar kinase n=1 Tax=Sandaracinomonas limnophila TaxID=1862386 RepID=A0A437PUP2_9BACT|nr:sugar kinase [Sandaracinomonas limnophila]RVU25965.1 sugar kinase [Sandaracinomonas limnophila]